jgi:putative glycosyltransferase (TIGR04372 family)
VPYTFSPNKSYLQLLSTYFTFIELDKHAWTDFQPMIDKISEKMGALSVLGETLDEYEAFNQIEKHFRKKFGVSASLFNKKSIEIPDEQLDILASHKILGSKFVGFHVRDSVTPLSRSAGNCDITTYIEAIRLLLDQDIRVVIQGNMGMKLLPDSLRNHPLIWDYAHDANKHSSLDMYFFSHAFFLVGSASGPITIGNDFGVPTLYTNLPCLGYHYDLRGYSLPHLIIDKKSGFELPYSEILKSPLAWSIREETNQHIRRRNSAQEIKDAVQDMLNDSVSIELNLWHGLRQSQHFGGAAPAMTIAPSFYSAHQELLNI